MSSISKLQTLGLDHCKYKVTIKFSCYDALTAKNLKVDTILIDEKTIYDVDLERNPANVVINSNGEQYSYDVEFRTTLSFNIKIEKNNYFPFTALINLADYNAEKGSFSALEEIPITVDLGKFPLLSLYKTNAIVLGWNKYPKDLDAYLTNPDNSQTYFLNRTNYYSNVDIDDTSSDGPETISVLHWTDLTNENAVNTTFKYDVNWKEDGSNDVNSISATVSLFVDPENIKVFQFPSKYDNKNRLGKNWHVFELDVKSVYNENEVPQSSFIKSVYVNENHDANLDIFHDAEEWEHLNFYYQKIFKNFNFIIDIVDDLNNSVLSSFTYEKVVKNNSYYTAYYQFNTTLSRDKANNCTIKFYLSDAFKEKNIEYFSIKYNDLMYDWYEEYNEEYYDYYEVENCVRAKDIFENKQIPFKMIAYDNEEIKNVKYRWDDYHGRLYIEILNRKYSLSEIKIFEYYLGVDYVINYDSLYNQNNELCKNPDNLYWYFYEDKNYFDDAKFYKENGFVNLLSEISLKKHFDEDNNTYKNFYFDYPSVFDVYAVPYEEFSREFDLNVDNNIEEQENFYKYYIKTNALVNGRTCELKYDKLIIKNIYDFYNGNEKKSIETDLTKVKEIILMDININLNIDKHYKVEKIYKAGTSIEITNFSYVWSNEGIIINFDNSYDYQDIDIIFKYSTIIFSKKQLNYGIDENGNEYEVYPNVYLYDDSSELHLSKYYSIWYPTELKIIFTDDLKSNVRYSAKLIDYLKIYKFNVYELNYFDKNYTVKFDIINYDDIVSGEVTSRQKLGNINFNFLGRDFRGKTDVFNLAYGKSEPTNSNYKYVQNYEFDLNNAGIRMCWDYLASFKTLYSHKGFYEHIKLYDETPSTCTKTDGYNDETKEYILQYPLVNFYGWFTDSLGNTLANFFQQPLNASNDTLSRFFKSFMISEKERLKIKLVNCDPMLSSSLSYDYCFNFYYTYNNDGTVNEHQISNYENNDRPWNEEYINMYNFFFKNKFSGDNLFPDNDINAPRQNRYAVYPGFYNMSVFLNDILLFNKNNLDLTKDAESKGLTYNVKFEFPLVNFTGCIRNIATNSKEYKEGVKVILLNNTNNMFKNIPNWFANRSNFHIATINGREYRKVNEGFALVGCCYPLGHYICPILVGKTPESVICDQGSRQYLEFEYNGEIWYCNMDDYGFHDAYPSYNYSGILLNSIDEVNSLGLEDNDENRFQYWKDMAKRFLDMYFEKTSYFPEESSDIFNFPNIFNYSNSDKDFNFIFQGFSSSNGHASSGLKSGTYTLTVEYKDMILYKDENFIINKDREKSSELYNYEIPFPLCNFNGKILSNGDHIYGKDWMIIFENKEDKTKSRNFIFDDDGKKKIFEFKGFGNETGSGSNYYSMALYEGNYNVIIKYKESIIKTFENVIISKNDEIAGKYNNHDFDVGDIYINLSGRFIDSQFNNLIRKNTCIKLCEENFDGNVSDDIFNEFKLISENYGNYLNEYKKVYNFENLFKNGYYAIKVVSTPGSIEIYSNDDFDFFDYEYEEHYECDEIPICGMVKSSKTVFEIEESDTYPSSYFDNYTELISSNLYYSSGKIHESENLIKLSDAISNNGLASYDIYLKYSYVWFNYVIYYKFDPKLYLRIPINVRLTNTTLKNGEQDDVITDFSYNNNSNYKTGSLIKSGIYDMNISLKDHPEKVLYNKKYEASQRTIYDVNKIELNETMNDIQAILVTKYHTTNENGCTYQVLPFSNSYYNDENAFLVNLKYNINKDDDNSWKDYYSYNSKYHKMYYGYYYDYEDGGALDEKLNSSSASSYIYSISGENKSQKTDNLLLKYTINTIGFEQLCNNVFIKLENPTYNGYEVEVKGIYNDVYNGVKRNKNNQFASLIYPQFYNNETEKYDTFGHISSLFTDERYDSNSYNNYLKRHLLSGNFDINDSNNLIDNDLILKSDLLQSTDTLKIILLDKVLVNISGKIYNKSSSSILLFGGCLNLLVKIYSYDKETGKETFVRSFYYNSETFTLDGLYIGLYKFRYFLNNIELFEAEKNKIHEFNFNDNNYKINLEKEFPTLSGNLYLKYNENEHKIDAIDHVFIDIINNDLSGISYYGLNMNIYDYDEYYYSFGENFIQNSSWPVTNNNEDLNFGKINWPNLLEGNYTIKYYLAPTVFGANDHYHYYGDGICHYDNDGPAGTEWSQQEIDSCHFIRLSSNENKDIFNNIINCLSSQNKTFTISIDHLYEYVKNYHRQFLNSSGFRIFRIICKISYFKNYNDYDYDYEEYYRSNYAILRFDDIFPTGGVLENLNKNKSISITLKSNLNDIILEKTNNFDYDRYEIDKIYISFADLYSSDQLFVTPNMSILTKDFNYMYTCVTRLICNGYKRELHNNENVKTDLFDSSNNSFGTYNEISGPNSFRHRCDDRTFINYYFGLRTDNIYRAIYFRNDFQLGEKSDMILKCRKPKFIINSIELNTLSGSYTNKSIEDCKRSSNSLLTDYQKNSLQTYIPHSITTRVFYMGDKNGNNGDLGYYYEQTNESEQYDFEFTSLLASRNDFLSKVNYSDSMGGDDRFFEWVDNNSNDLITKPILSISFDENTKLIRKNIEIPYVKFKIEYEFCSKKSGVNDIPPYFSGFLRRCQHDIIENDGYDIDINLENLNKKSDSFIVKSGYYKDIKFIVNEGNEQVIYSYQPMVINSDIKFKFYHYCGNAKTVQFEVKKNGTPQPNCNIYIYDENENLMLIIKTNNSGVSSTALYDIPYKFKAIDESYNFKEVSSGVSSDKIIISY